jgi:hypothetical protein
VRQAAHYVGWSRPLLQLSARALSGWSASSAELSSHLLRCEKASLRRVSAVKRSDNFREQAAHCVRMAQVVPIDERPLMLEMAQQWLNLAQQAEKNEAVEMTFERAAETIREVGLPAE